jgi:hypothetical protein
MDYANSSSSSSLVCRYPFLLPSKASAFSIVVPAPRLYLHPIVLKISALGQVLESPAGPDLIPPPSPYRRAITSKPKVVAVCQPIATLVVDSIPPNPAAVKLSR